MQVVREDGGTDNLVAGDAELGTALIHFCRHEKIPLPIRASKLVGIVDGKLALVCFRDRKDYLPLDSPFPDDTVAESAGGRPGMSVSEVSPSLAKPLSPKLKKVRRRPREKAAS